MTWLIMTLHTQCIVTNHMLCLKIYGGKIQMGFQLQTPFLENFELIQDNTTLLTLQYGFRNTVCPWLACLQSRSLSYCKCIAHHKEKNLTFKLSSATLKPLPAAEKDADEWIKTVKVQARKQKR